MDFRNSPPHAQPAKVRQAPMRLPTVADRLQQALKAAGAPPYVRRCARETSASSFAFTACCAPKSTATAWGSKRTRQKPSRSMPGPSETGNGCGLWRRREPCGFHGHRASPGEEGAASMDAAPSRLAQVRGRGGGSSKRRSPTAGAAGMPRSSSGPRAPWTPRPRSTGGRALSARKRRRARCEARCAPRSAASFRFRKSPK